MKNLIYLRDLEATGGSPTHPNYYAGLDDQGGAFELESCVDGARIFVIASTGEGWDHVSASRADRCPTWEEMCQVKEAFFEDEDCAIQYHPPKSEYVNFHPHCLHLWAPNGGMMPLPPSYLVGPKEGMKIS